MSSETEKLPRRARAAKPTRAKPARAKPATLADVAAMAGVVPMTASRALNRSGYVSADVRERVATAARALQYRPNMLARQLRGSRLHAIGIMLPDIANPFVAELMKGITPVLRAAGFTGFIATAGHSVEDESAAIQAFVDHRTDGMLVATRGTSMGDEVLKGIAANGVPIVTIGRPVAIPSIDCVTADHYQGAFDAVTHLITLGHRRIGFIGASPQDTAHLRRYHGYVAALEAAGIAHDPAYAVGTTSGPAFATEEDGFLGLIAMRKLAHPPTAIFARNDFAAIGALRAAHTLHLRVPQDIAIAGFDNIPIAAYQTPPLTTVDQPIVEQGRIAAEFLLKRIEATNTIRRQTVQLPCKLVIRESTDIAKRGAVAASP
jgi:DNA-binding LacI/PurR family transcriptional regulator